MSEKPILYITNLSGPARAVRIVAQLLDVELELRPVDLANEEHLREPFTKLNPEHTVPTLIDNGVVIWDSHAIAGYLVDKYAKTDDLYPKDLYLRAKCNQRMLFNASTLFVRIRDLCRDVFARGCTERCPDKLSQIADGYDILEAFLATDPFLVGLQLTIADICVAVTVLLLEIHLPLHADKHSKIVEWIKRVNRTIPFFNKMNMQPVAEFRELIESSYQKNKESQ